MMTKFNFQNIVDEFSFKFLKEEGGFKHFIVNRCECINFKTTCYCKVITCYNPFDGKGYTIHICNTLFGLIYNENKSILQPLDLKNEIRKLFFIYNNNVPDWFFINERHCFSKSLISNIERKKVYLEVNFEKKYKNTSRQKELIAIDLRRFLWFFLEMDEAYPFYVINDFYRIICEHLNNLFKEIRKSRGVKAITSIISKNAETKYQKNDVINALNEILNEMILKENN